MATLNLSLPLLCFAQLNTPNCPHPPCLPVWNTPRPRPNPPKTPLLYLNRRTGRTPHAMFWGWKLSVPSVYIIYPLSLQCLCCNSLILIFVLNRTAFHARWAIFYDINNHITIIMDSYSLSMLICLLVVIYLLLFHEVCLRVFVDMCKWGLQMKTMNEIKKKSVLYYILV